MRWTRYFIPTVRETPADAVVPSHRLMIRAGLIRQVIAGAYTYLPLGLRVLRRIENIVREEMNRAGAIELHMTAMQPIELWDQTGRTQAMGDVLIRLPDKPWRRGTVLGPTHEEVVTDIVRTFVHSYRQLPLNLYQIQTKFRDEERPKSGVLRTREFLMKDAYSFDADLEGLDRSYRLMYEAYCRIFERCGLPYVVVEAESGPIGGEASHEFMVVTDAGEDMLVRTPDGRYAANLERAAVHPLDPPPDRSPQPLREVHTPGLRTVEEVCRFLGREPADMIKTLIYLTPEGQPLVALVRGDHEVAPAKLARAAGATSLTLADPDTIRRLTGADVGFAGPQGLAQRGARIICDQAVSVMIDAASGANRTDYHVVGLQPGRDFQPTCVADIRQAVPGDRAPDGSPLIFEKCIEVGHVFKLGTKYSEALHAVFHDEQGREKPMIMGCYGIGINRIMAAAIESHHDDAGIIWPIAIAPFHVLIVAVDVGDENVMQVASRLHDDLTARGLDVLLDDRDQRPGPKFKDADLIGIPIRLTVGRRSLAAGGVELKRRDGTEVRTLPPSDAVAAVCDTARDLGLTL